VLLDGHDLGEEEADRGEVVFVLAGEGAVDAPGGDVEEVAVGAGVLVQDDVSGDL